MTYINPFTVRPVNPTQQAESSRPAEGSTQEPIVQAGQTSADKGFTIEKSDAPPLTPEEIEAKKETHDKEVDEIQAMKEKSQARDFSKLKGIEEVRNLKALSQMSMDEMKAELDSYGINYEGLSDFKIRKLLSDVRDARAEQDAGSDEVDGHIGTYVQGQGNKYCSVLSYLDRMSDEEIANLFTVRTDENGKKVYTVTFPIDQGTDNTVEITEDELRSGQITVTENGQERVLTNFPTGDLDVTMLTMAYAKRFGQLQDHGAWIFQTNNNFRRPDGEVLYDNQYLEDMDIETLLEHTTVGVLNSEELARKGIEVQPMYDQDLSWITDPDDNMAARMGKSGVIFTLSDGRKACICDNGIFLSDGTRVPGAHAVSIRGYDETTQELIVSGSEFNNQSEVRIPIELLKFLETASTATTAGVARTPEPDV